MTSPSAPASRRLVVDTHAHGTHLLPAPVKGLHRVIQRGQPHDVGFGALRAAGVDAIVAAPVGDRLVTQFHWPSSPWRSVLGQFRVIRREAKRGGCVLATTSAQVAEAADAGRTAVILGLEGGDTLAEDLGRVAELHELGVRVVGIMHYADNPFGTICMGFRGADSGEEVAAGRTRGLTELGGTLVDELNARDMIIDVAHSDDETLAAICERSTRPVIASHTGARVLDEFPRYLSDSGIRAVAATGGAVGLWPFRAFGHGMVDAQDFARHATHIASLVGAEHVCIGTDMNGVPGLLEGYDGPQHLHRLFEALEGAGFSSTEIDGIVGGNFLRLL